MSGGESADREPIGVVLLGYEGAGTQNHQLDMYEQAFVAHPGCRIAAVADLGAREARVECAQQRAEVLGVPFLDPAEALSLPGVRLASVCVGFEHRVEAVRLAAGAGVATLVDKPMALTADDLDSIETIASAAGTWSAPAHHLRFRREIRRHDLSGLGDLHLAQAEFIATSGATLATADTPSVWPLGELMNFCVYPIDTLMAMTGQQPTDVVAVRGGHFFGGADDEDFGVLRVGFDGGLSATVTVGRVPFPGHLAGLVHRYRYVGTAGVVDIDAVAPRAVVHGAVRSRTVPAIDEPNSVVGLVDHLVAALHDGSRPEVTIDDARASLLVTLAARRSSDLGTRVSVSEV